MCAQTRADLAGIAAEESKDERNAHQERATKAVTVHSDKITAQTQLLTQVAADFGSLTALLDAIHAETKRRVTEGPVVGAVPVAAGGHGGAGGVGSVVMTSGAGGGGPALPALFRLNEKIVNALTLTLESIHGGEVFAVIQREEKYRRSGVNMGALKSVPFGTFLLMDEIRPYICAYAALYITTKTREGGGAPVYATQLKQDFSGKARQQATKDLALAIIRGFGNRTL